MQTKILIDSKDKKIEYTITYSFKVYEIAEKTNGFIIIKAHYLILNSNLFLFF